MAYLPFHADMMGWVGLFSLKLTLEGSVLVNRLPCSAERFSRVVAAISENCGLT